MFLKKAVLGFGIVMLIAFAGAAPAFASIPDEEVKVEGTVQSIDFVAGTFTLLTEDGSEITVDAPAGFDLSLLVPGTFVEAKGSAGLDDVVNATEIENQDGTEFEVEDESGDDNGVDDNDAFDDHGQDVDDDDDDINDDHGQDMVDASDDVNDDHGGDSGNSGSDHEEDGDSSGSSGSGSDHDSGEDD